MSNITRKNIIIEGYVKLKSYKIYFYLIGL